jgi:hypothetical protein
MNSLKMNRLSNETILSETLWHSAVFTVRIGFIFTCGMFCFDAAPDEKP